MILIFLAFTLFIGWVIKGIPPYSKVSTLGKVVTFLPILNIIILVILTFNVLEEHKKEYLKKREKLEWKRGFDNAISRLNGGEDASKMLEEVEGLTVEEDSYDKGYMEACKRNIFK